jgi:toxin ParE1/3/4
VSLRVVFAPEAEAQLGELYDYIAGRATPEVAGRYVEGVIDYCEGLAVFPTRGSARDDIRPGLRTTSYRKRTVIAFAVSGDRLMIVGLFHGGPDYESALGLED